MRIENAQQHDIEEEAFWTAFAVRQVAIVEVGTCDRGIVCAVPRACGRIGDERHPQLDRMRRRRSSHSAAAGDNLAAVAQQSLVDRTPPWTTWRHCVHWRQHAAAELPAHERHGRPAKWQVPRRPADRAVIVRASNWKGPLDRHARRRPDEVPTPRRSSLSHRRARVLDLSTAVAASGSGRSSGARRSGVAEPVKPVAVAGWNRRSW
jgi:hypothetical protein